MSARRSFVPVDPSEEIPVLIERLLATEQRLEELTAGEVDTVASRDGRTFLLRRAQEQLRHREAEKQAAILTDLRVLVDLMPAMVWFKDTENRFLRVNQRVATATGRSVAEIEGKPAVEIYPQEAAKYYADDLEVIRSGVPKLGIVETLRDAQGKEFWVHTDKVPVFDKSGKVTGLVVMAQDISVQKQAEEKLRESEARFAEAFEHAPIGVALVALDGRWLKVNRALCTLVGYPEAELLKSTFQHITFPADLEKDLERVRQMLAGEISSYEMEKRYIHARGHLVTVLLNVSLIHDSVDQPRYFIAQMQDITERKQAEESIRRLAAIVEHSADAIISKTLEGIITSWNPAAEKMFGYTAREILGQPLHLIVPAELRSEEAEILAGLKRGDPVRHFETVRLKKDGGRLDVSVTVSPVRDHEGRIVGASKIVRDVTERKRASALLTESQQRLTLATEAVRMGVWEWDLATDKLTWDAQMLELYGVAEGNFTGAYDAWRNGLHPDDRERAEAELAAAVKEGKDFHLEFRVVWPNGEVHALEAHARVSRASPSSTARVVGVNRDITERKRAERALRESEEHFRFLNELADATRSLANPGKIMEVTSRMLGGHLHASRCAYADVEKDGEHFVILHDYTDGCASTVGSYLLSLFGPKAVANLHRGQTLVVRDVDTELAPDEGADMFNAIGIKAIVSCPLIREGTLRAIMAVHQTAPRDWKPAEVALIEEVTGRCWATIERRTAEEKLRQNETLLRIAGRSARLGGWAVDVPGVHVTWSDEVCAIHDLPPGAAPTLEQAIAFYAPESRATIAKAFATCAQDGTSFDLELEIVTAKGRRVSVRAIGEVQRNPGGVIVRVQGAFQDISERKHTEESLRLLGSAVAHSKESIVITDAELDLPGPRIIFVNPAFTQMTGYTAEEAIGKTPRLLQGPRTDQNVLSRLRKCLARGEVFQGEAINYRKDGTEFDLDWQVAPMRNAGGEVTHFVAIQRDATARKRAEDALRTSEKRFKTLFDQAAVGVAVTDANGRFVQANQRYCTLVGRTPEELMELTSSAITHPDDMARSLEVERQIKEGLAREATNEKRYVRKDGTEVRASETMSPMWSPGETPDYFIAVALDITAQKQLEEQFRQAQKMEAIGTLAGGIAHDFNNVLAAINGYTELAKMESVGNATVWEYLDAVLHGARRATDLVRQILAFSRQQELERKPIQLRDVVEEALKLLRATIPTTIEFETALDAVIPNVLADASQVHQILMNLCTNAAHAMRDRSGRLMIKLEKFNVGAELAATRPGLKCGVYARLSVSDTGSGMDQATMSRIFEPFFTTKAPGEGTGLGLAVVHGIMQSHEGAVTVYSHLGEGTTFHLYFPEHVSMEAAVAVRPLTAAPWGLGERILYVDDEETLVVMAKKILERLGYIVETCANAAEALALLQTHPDAFDAVVTDQTMPGMTGTALAEKIHALRPNLPIILTTGYSATLTLEGVQAIGVRKLLLKPLTFDALGSAVSAVLREAKAI